MNQAVLRIDKNAKLPLYYQLKEILLQEIRSMQPDEMIAPESMLIEKYGVSRTTVRQAIAELIAEKYLYTIRGKGTFVADRKVDLYK
ncbi:MAG: GntR family transcriptional regulator [Lachnospiraceae bacterium]|nr:GntR family transcriptional regulator [Lachnospiraceae bacterium]MCI8996554.1 GntR family transcriptional regulator [Lachnospiraceae bacterium]MCI9134372.1 GntR family transcriptional regulator [Lachnospiraceae bacterium]